MKFGQPNGRSWNPRTPLQTLGMFPLLALICLWALASGCTGAKSEDTFDAFWTQFREAVLAHDADRVAALTSFPFKTRGPLDSDAVQRHDRAAFRKQLDKWLQQDAGMAKEVEPMLKFIERTPQVRDKSYGDGGDSARVGTFLFQKIEGQWRFVLAYVDG